MMGFIATLAILAYSFNKGYQMFIYLAYTL